MQSIAERAQFLGKGFRHQQTEPLAALRPTHLSFFELPPKRPRRIRSTKPSPPAPENPRISCFIKTSRKVNQQRRQRFSAATTRTCFRELFIPAPPPTSSSQMAIPSPALLSFPLRIPIHCPRRFPPAPASPSPPITPGHRRNPSIVEDHSRRRARFIGPGPADKHSRLRQKIPTRGFASNILCHDA